MASPTTCCLCRSDRSCACNQSSVSTPNDTDCRIDSYSLFNVPSCQGATNNKVGGLLPASASSTCSLFHETASSDNCYGARSKQFYSLKSELEVPSASDIQCDPSDSNERLHEWREAGHALLNYLNLPDQSDPVVPSDARPTQYHDLCSTCWDFDTSEGNCAKSTECCYASMIPLQITEPTNDSTFRVPGKNVEPIYSNNVVDEGASRLYGDLDLGSSIIPLFDELREKLTRLNIEREKRRKKSLDSRAKRQQQRLSFSSDSSSSESERELPHFRRRYLQQNLVLGSCESKSAAAVFDRCPTGVCDASSEKCHNAKTSRLKLASKCTADFSSLTRTLACEQLNPCSQLMSYSADIDDTSSSLCSELNMLSNISTETSSDEEIGVDDGASNRPGMVKKADCATFVTTKLTSDNKKWRPASPFCSSYDQSLQCDSASSLSSGCNSPFHLCHESAKSSGNDCGSKTIGKLYQPCTLSCSGNKTTDLMTAASSYLLDTPYNSTSFSTCLLSSMDFEPNGITSAASPPAAARATSIRSATSNANGDLDHSAADEGASFDEPIWDFPIDNVESEADDEFECDCPVCLINRDHIRDDELFQSQVQQLAADNEHSGATASNPLFAPFTTDDEPDYFSVFGGHGNVLESLFQDVIIQMLQIYPDLFINHTPTPITAEQFGQLKSFCIVQSELDGDTSCSICLCPFEDGEEAKCLPCRHSFHSLCIQAWLNKAGTCPVCRDVVMSHMTSGSSPRD